MQEQAQTQGGGTEPWYRLPDSMIAWEQRKADRYNAEQGGLPDYNCSTCKNKGRIAFVSESGYMTMRPCRCMNARKSIALAKKSGAYSLLQKHSFDNFNTGTEWRRSIKALAMAYADGQEGWMYAGGQSGAGKTHLCTSAFKAFIKRNIQGTYMLWRDEARKILNAGFAESRETEQHIVEIKQAGMLYIDDLFKTDDGKMPERREIELAFEIINFRYNNDLPMIISSEITIAELAKMNQAIAGRIKQKCGRHIISVEYDEQRNWRLGGVG